MVHSVSACLPNVCTSTNEALILHTHCVFYCHHSPPALHASSASSPTWFMATWATSVQCSLSSCSALRCEITAALLLVHSLCPTQDQALFSVFSRQPMLCDSLSQVDPIYSVQFSNHTGEKGTLSLLFTRTHKSLLCSFLPLHSTLHQHTQATLVSKARVSMETTCAL